MKLKIRYEGEYQTINLDTEATEELWVSLSLEGEELTQEQREQLIQETFDKEFNRPEYNNYHKETRHVDPNPKRKLMSGKRGYIQAEKGDESFKIMDYLAVSNDDHSNLGYEELCAWVRNVLAKKPEWAEAFIKVRLDGMSIRDYAAKIGASENNITQKLGRAAKKLMENFPKP